MKHDHSFGIIPIILEQNQWKVLLVQHHSGHWAFPKGHPENHETPLESAERELFEETGLRVEKVLSTVALRENYFFRHQEQLINKKVDYFMALVEGKIVLQAEEIQASQWLSLEEAIVQMTFKEGKSLCLQAKNFLESSL